MSNAEHLSASGASETPKTRGRKERVSMEQHPSSGLSDAEVTALGKGGITRVMRSRILIRKTPFSPGARHSDWTRMILHERRQMKEAREKDEDPAEHEGKPES